MFRVIGTVIFAILLILCVDKFALIGQAADTVKIKVAGANIRKEATTDSEIVGNVKKDSELTVLSQVTAADGKVWYQVKVDANTNGYIRFDLVNFIADTGANQTTGGNTGTTTPINNANVTEVVPVSGTVKGAETVRVRSDADTKSNDNVVASAKKGTALTVTGTTSASDGKTWYRVKFVEDGKEINGFIRADYIELAGELKEPVVEDPVEEKKEEEKKEEQTVVETPVVEKKKFEVQFDKNEAKWILINNEQMVSYDVEQVLQAATENAKLYLSEHNKVGTQKIVIIILVCLLLLLAGVIGFLVYKMKDAMDAAYIAQVEKETMKRRTADRPDGQKASRPAPENGEKKKVNPEQRPQGGQRPQGQRPEGAKPAGTRPAGARPAGARPAGARPDGTRPQGQRPAGVRPEGARPQVEQPKTVAPAAEKVPTEAPASKEAPVTEPVKRVEAPAEEKVVEVIEPTVKPAEKAPLKEAPQKEAGWKSKNFAQDDDEFEFEFLNWNGDDDK